MQHLGAVALSKDLKRLEVRFLIDDLPLFQDHTIQVQVFSFICGLIDLPFVLSGDQLKGVRQGFSNPFRKLAQLFFRQIISIFLDPFCHRVDQITMTFFFGPFGNKLRPVTNGIVFGEILLFKIDLHHIQKQSFDAVKVVKPKK